ncbi:MAG: VWA domain-containing protein [Armatimonadota bacterium]|nr:VWA domain-containing protein [Armatimonadota bacterium]MDR7457994.1 VWA domain-containing protein [Armatimonadota bacterium]MDR7512043.1 VWA domain-containing protein [Armatimonadota bacterium]
MSLTFVWPALLWALLLVPAGVAAYVWFIRRLVVRPVTFPDVPVLAEAGRAAGRWRRHGAAAALLGALALVIVAVSRPVMPIPVPADRVAIMLVVDHSGSMRSTDIEPNRLEAAKAAARAFLKDISPRVHVGLVGFGGYATLLAPPGTDHDTISRRLDDLYYIRRTAIGDGLLEALAALPGRVRPDPDGSLPRHPQAPLAPGVIILLSDGRSNAGFDAVRAAEIARAQNVVVHTVGVGAREWQPGAFTLGTLDESELQAVARAGGGTYHHASSAEALRDVYRGLARSVGWERRPDEVAALFALGGAATLVGALVIARWFTHPMGI